ncbi:MmyB family transcriptional regulator [Nocardia gipuzkoensis]
MRGGVRLNRRPAHRQPRRSAQPSIPTLSTTCWMIRDHLGLSRVGSYERTRVSASYLNQIESGERIPSLETLNKLIRGYRLDSAQARHLLELRAPAEDLAPAQNLRRLVRENDGLMTHIHALEERGVLGAYMDPMWNVLACNDSFRSALPGLDASESVPVWLFSPAARDIVIDWDREAAHSVATTKAVLGRYRRSEQARELMRQLRPNSAFGRLWASSISISYGRSTGDQLHWRDLDTGELISYSLTMSEISETGDVLLLTALPVRYRGPNIEVA